MNLFYKIKSEKAIYILVFFGILSFLSLELIFKLKPCFLCQMQRIPYYIGGLLCLAHFCKIINKKAFLILIILCFFSALCISIFHIFVEEGILQFSCNSITANTVETLKMEMQNAKPECSAKAYISGFRITYLSSLYNFLIVSYAILEGRQ